jgi:hypothetical protein
VEAFTSIFQDVEWHRGSLMGNARHHDKSWSSFIRFCGSNHDRKEEDSEEMRGESIDLQPVSCQELKEALKRSF